MIEANLMLAANGEITPMSESMHFGVVPNPGETVEIEGALFVISNVVHTPSIHSAGAKIRVTIRPK